WVRRRSRSPDQNTFIDVACALYPCTTRTTRRHRVFPTHPGSGSAPSRASHRHEEAISLRYFYDSEFIEDGSTIDLISIGVVCEDGREYYAVSTEFDASRAGPWVRKHVLPKLPPAGSPLYRTREQI